MSTTHDSLFSAIKTILVADIIVSLDNTLDIARVANGDFILLITGLVLSIPLIIFGSTIIMKMINRFPVIVYIGAGLIAYTAGEMIGSDRAVQPYLPAIFNHTAYLPLVLTVGVIGIGGWYNATKGRSAKDVLSADEKAAQRLDDQLG